MRIVVLGADGLVGRALVRQGGVMGVGRADGDLASAGVRERILDRLRPDAVIFCAAFTRVDAAAVQAAEAERINVEAPAAWARRVPVWWLSSNFVFFDGGPLAPYDAEQPVGVYARQKAAGEAAVLAAGGRVCRVGWVYGPGGRTFASTLVARLQAGERVNAVADVLVQPTHADDLARSLVRLPEATISHHMGRDEVSWYGFASALLAQLAEPANARVQAVRQDELRLPEPRPRDARLLGAVLPGWRHGMLRLMREG